MPYAAPAPERLEQISRAAVARAAEGRDDLRLKLVPVAVAVAAAAIIILLSPSLHRFKSEDRPRDISSFISSLSDEEIRALVYDTDIDSDFYEYY